MLDNNQNVIIQPYQFKSSKVMKTPYGLTIHEIVDQMYSHSNIPPNRRRYDILVEIDGVPIERDRWNFVPNINSHILVSTLVHGDQGGGDGKLILRSIMMLAVVVMSIYAPYLAPSGWGMISATGAVKLSGVFLSMAVMTAGSMLVNAIAPIRPLDVTPSANKDPKQAYSITGSQNRANLFGSIPVVLGRHKMFPVYGTAPTLKL